MHHSTKQTIASLGEAMLERTHQVDWRLTRSFAGGTLNTAIYLSRLLDPMQFCIHYVTAVGTDPYSDHMLASWHQEYLNIDLVVRVKDRLPGLYLIRTDAQGERNFYYYHSHSAARKLFTDNEHSRLLTSLTTMNYLYLSAILELAWACVERTLTLCDIVLLTFSDDQQLFGDNDPQATVKRLMACGVTKIVVRWGAKPCLVVHDNMQTWVHACHVAPLVDTTGASDAFNAGYLARPRYSTPCSGSIRPSFSRCCHYTAWGYRSIKSYA